MRMASASEIEIGRRHRRDLGDMDALAASIRERGLLHPIVITSGGRLVCGERRLWACRDVLGWDKIPARVIECDATTGQWHENEIRKSYSPSERAALAEVLRLQGGVTAADQAAIQAGFGSKRGYYRAAQVVETGLPELVEAMDSGAVTIATAAQIAAQPAERQRELLRLDPQARRRALLELRRTAATEETKRAATPPAGAPTAARLAVEMARLAGRIDASVEAAAHGRAGRTKARKAAARLADSVGALLAALDAADVNPPKRRRGKNRRQEPGDGQPVVVGAATISAEELSARWDRLTDIQRARANTKAEVIRGVADAHERDGVLLRDAFTLAARGSDWSIGTLRDWYYGKADKAGLVEYPRHLWPLVLAPRHIGRVKGAVCDAVAWQAFLADYLRPEQPPLEMSYRTLKRLADKQGWTIPGSSRALKRRLDREVHPAAVVLARQGPEAVARMRPAQIRARGSLRALEAVNADGHVFDVFVEWPDGKVERPVLTAWQDIHSGKILSWRLDRTENADGYRLSFADLLREYGIPVHVFVDNGRGIASKMLTGGTPNRYRFKVKHDEPTGLLTQLVGPDNIHWTTPYSGQSKPIERAFRDLATDIAKDFRLRGAYTGNAPGAKPANHGEKAVELERFVEVAADGIREHNARRGRRGLGLEGRSFDEAFAASYEAHAADIPRATEAQLARWLPAALAITAHQSTGAVHLYGNRYWSERLAETLAGKTAAERKVVVRFDPDHLDRAVTVETLEGRLIAQAEAQDAVPVMSTREARETARDKAQLKKNARANLAIHRRMDDRKLGGLLDAAAADSEGADEERPAVAAKVVCGAFGRGPSRAGAAAAEEIDPLVSRGDDLILEAAAAALPKVDEETA